MNDYEKLKDLYLQSFDIIKNDNISENKYWMNNCESIIYKKFGSKSIEFRQFENELYSDLSFERKVKKIREMLLNFMDDCDFKKQNSIKSKTLNNKIFIVHGHDDVLKYQAARVIESQGIEAIILHEQVNGGMKSIIDKVESYGDTVSAAIILFTPDDKGKSIKEKTLKNRARQNVVLEAGYFIGHLGKDKVIPIVSDESIEMPSDLNGIVYNKDNWQLKLIKELEAIGFDVDANKLPV